MEWGEPLAAAVRLLQQQGHRRIAYATTSHPFLATQMGRRRFDYLQATLAGIELQAITVPHLPDENYEAALVRMITASLDASGQLPFTALVAWGIEDGARFRELLREAGVGIPALLSVVLLGRTDLANEHANFFDTIGCSVADQVEYLHQAINARWADPSIPYGVRLIPVTTYAGQSIATLPMAGEPHGQGLQKPVRARSRAFSTGP
jgi:DNA-binding LacI/PurR family transcriptional regulator